MLRREILRDPLKHDARQLMPAQTLRPYQTDALKRVIDAWRDGARSVLLVAPTGSGKTSVFSSLAAQVQLTQGVLINTHRRELVDQAANRLREFGVEFGLIMSGEARNPRARTQIATVQTLVKRQFPRAALVINDEAHLSTAATWTTILAQYPHARILGVTATPWRLGGKPLAGAYDAIVIAATPAELRQQGYLCDYVGFSYLAPDLSEVSSNGSEFNEKESAAAMSGTLIVDNVVEQWGTHARELSTVVFAVTVEHSKQLTARFKAAGVRAEHLDGQTPLFQRQAILRRVDRGETRVLCNVGVAVEGLDIPRLKCCVLARPTMSLARAIQMMGRVRRPWQEQVARIHDHAFNIKRHGLPDQDRDYSLNSKAEKPPSLSTCSECLAVYTGSACPACGAQNEVKPAAERVLQTVADAEQFEFSSDETPAAPVREERPPVTIRWDTLGREIAGLFVSQSEEQTEYGPQKRYLIRSKTRDYNLPGTTRLNALMSKVPEGSNVRIKYLSDTKLPQGRARKEFKVWIDDPAETEQDRTVTYNLTPRTIKGKLIASVRQFCEQFCEESSTSTTSGVELYQAWHALASLKGFKNTRPDIFYMALKIVFPSLSGIEQTSRAGRPVKGVAKRSNFPTERLACGTTHVIENGPVVRAVSDSRFPVVVDEA